MLDILFIKASQNPIHHIQHMHGADFGPSLSMFEKAADVEFSDRII